MQTGFFSSSASILFTLPNCIVYLLFHVLFLTIPQKNDSLSMEKPWLYFFWFSYGT